MSFELVPGSDLTLNRENLTISRKFRATEQLPVSISGDYFDHVSNTAIGWIRQYYPTYDTAYGRLYWNSIQLHEKHYAQFYDLTVVYSPFKKETGSYQVTVDQTGGTQHVTSGQVIGAFGTNAPTNLTEVCQAIGKDGDTVDGTDVPIPQTKLTVMYRHPQMFLSMPYIKALDALVGFPNNDTFLTYDPGEVMYLGGNFSQTNTEGSATYQFAISRNETNFVVNGITVDIKYGWDILDEVLKPNEGDGRAIKELDYLKTIRPAARRWKNYVSAFGWGEA